MRTSFVRPEAPALICTADLRQLKRSATRATSSALALPSTGGALSVATQVPSCACTSEDARELGLTLICSVMPAMTGSATTNDPLVHRPAAGRHDRGRSAGLAGWKERVLKEDRRERGPGCRRDHVAHPAVAGMAELHEAVGPDHRDEPLGIERRLEGRGLLRRHGRFALHALERNRQQQRV